MNAHASNRSPGTIESFLNIGKTTSTKPRSGRRKGAAILATIAMIASALALLVAGPALADDEDPLQVIKTSWKGTNDCGGGPFNPFSNSFPSTFDTNDVYTNVPVTFCVVVENTHSTDTIFDITVEDDVATSAPGDDFFVTLTHEDGTPGTAVTHPNGATGSAVDLAPGESAWARYTMTFADVGTYQNKAFAEGSDSPGGVPAWFDDDGTRVNIWDVEVTKTADQPVVDEGDQVTFAFEVFNNSQAEEFTLTGLNDSVFGDLATFPGSTCSFPQTLTQSFIVPTNSYSCSITVTFDVPGPWMAAVGTHMNTVTVEGNDDEGFPTSATDDEEVEVLDDEASIEIVKIATPTQVMAPGGLVDFGFTVTNTSTVDDVTINTINDSVFGVLDADCGLVDTSTNPMTPTPITLAPGGALTCSLNGEMISGAPGFQHYNQVTVDGTDDDGNPVTDDDDATVDVIGDPGSIEVAKDADPTSVPASGGDVTFTFTVANTSNVNVSITSMDDSVYGNLDGQGDCAASIASPQTLTPQGTAGDTYTCSITTFISGDPTLDHTNTLTVGGEDEFGNPVDGEDDEVVDIVEEGTIKIRKRADFNEVPESGEDVTFRFLIDNTSATVDITLTELIDSVYGDISVECGIDDAAGMPAPIVLAPGERFVCEIVRNVSGQAGTQHKNIVDVTGEDEGGNPVTDRARKKIDIIDEPGAISIVKTADVSSVPSTGGNVTFTFVITNDSAADEVTIDSLNDSVFGNITNSCTASPAGVVLAPGASHTCTLTRFIAPAAGSGTSSYTPTPPTTGSVGYVKPPHATPPCAGTGWYNHADTRMGSFGGYVLTLPTGLTLAPGTWAVDNFVAWDSDIDRPNYPQFQEIVRIEFLLNGAVVAVSNPTIDLPDYTVTAWFTGGLGTVNLPNGADQVNIVHSNIFNGSVGTNSLDPVSLCMVPIASDIEPHVNVAEVCATDDDGVTLCESDDETVTFDAPSNGGDVDAGDDGHGDEGDGGNSGGHPGGTACASGQVLDSNGDCKPDCKRNKRGKCKPQRPGRGRR